MKSIFVTSLILYKLIKQIAKQNEAGDLIFLNSYTYSFAFVDIKVYPRWSDLKVNSDKDISGNLYRLIF